MLRERTAANLGAGRVNLATSLGFFHPRCLRPDPGPRQALRTLWRARTRPRSRCASARAGQILGFLPSGVLTLLTLSPAGAAHAGGRGPVRAHAAQAHGRLGHTLGFLSSGALTSLTLCLAGAAHAGGRGPLRAHAARPRRRGRRRPGRRRRAAGRRAAAAGRPGAPERRVCGRRLHVAGAHLCLGDAGSSDVSEP
jgi:hypothetical protein